MKTFRQVINGRSVAAVSGKTLIVEDPSTMVKIAAVPHSGKADVDAAVRAAAAAFPKWSRLSAHARARHLYALARMVQRHALKVGKAGGDLKRELLRDAEIRRHLTVKEIEAVWGVKHHLGNVDFIFRRAFH